MLIKELLSMCKLNDSNLTDVLNAHPLQFITKEIEVPVWEIKYSYLTQRNNSKEAVKYIFKNELYWDGVENEFNLYIEEFNRKNPDRKLSNVEILETNYLGEFILELE